MRLTTIIIAGLLASSAYAQENDSASVSGEIKLFCAHHDLQYDSREACTFAQLGALSELSQRIEDGHSDEVTACMARSKDAQNAIDFVAAAKCMRE
jgi:hypothetical protein